MGPMIRQFQGPAGGRVPAPGEAIRHTFGVHTQHKEHV